MKRLVSVVVPIAALPMMLLLPGCDYIHTADTPTTTGSKVFVTETTGPATSSAAVAVPSVSSPDQVRHKRCTDLLPRLDDIRRSSGPGGVDREVADTVASLPESSEWASLTDEQRQATLDGIHDAAAGTCH